MSDRVICPCGVYARRVYHVPEKGQVVSTGFVTEWIVCPECGWRAMPPELSKPRTSNEGAS